jgi:hypothetical protein
MRDINPAPLRQHVNREQHGFAQSRDGLHVQRTVRINWIEVETDVHRQSPPLEQSPKPESKNIEKKGADQQWYFVVFSHNPKHPKQNPHDLAQTCCCEESYEIH